MDAKLMNDPDFLQKLGEHIKNNIQDIIEISDQRIAERKKEKEKILAEGPYDTEDLFFKIPDGYNADIFREECARAHRARKYYSILNSRQDDDFDKDRYLANKIAQNPEKLQKSSFYLGCSLSITSTDITRLAAQTGFVSYSAENSEIIAMHIFKKTGLCTYREKYNGRANLMALDTENKRAFFDMGMRMFMSEFDYDRKARDNGLEIMRNVVRFSSKEQLPYYKKKLYEMRTGGIKKQNLKIQEFFSNLNYYPGEKDFEVLGKKRFRPFSDPIKKQLIKGNER